jgi:hypothetical protein
MTELEAELQHLEDHIAQIRAEAKRRFLRAGSQIRSTPSVPGLKGKRKPRPVAERAP